MKPASTESAYDKLAVDIVAIYAGDGSVFEFKPGKLSRSPVAQSTASTQSRAVNWLRDNDMIRFHLPYIARIIGFGLDLPALNEFLNKNANPSTLILESFSQEIGRQLQQIRRNYGSRPVVFIGHGYGTVLVEKLLRYSDPPETEPDPPFTPLSEYLQKSTAAVVLFLPPSASNLLWIGRNPWGSAQSLPCSLVSTSITWISCGRTSTAT